MLKVTAYQDGKDFVVTFHNCNPAMKDLIEGLLHPVMAEESTLEPATEEEITDVLINVSRYQNKYASDILKEEGMKGYANLNWMLHNGKIADEYTKALHEMLAVFAYEAFQSYGDPYKTLVSTPMDECKEFLMIFGDYIPDDMKRSVAEQAGYADYSAFFANAGIEQIRAFMAAVIEKNK